MPTIDHLYDEAEVKPEHRPARVDTGPYVCISDGLVWPCPEADLTWEPSKKLTRSLDIEERLNG